MIFMIPFVKNYDYLMRTLKSLVTQTDSEWSAVLLDNSNEAAETNGALDCLEQVADQRIRYTRNQHFIGMAENWNQGFDLAASSELVVILHSDDVLKPDYVLEIKKLATLYPKAAGYFCQSEIIDEHDQAVFSMADFYKKLLVPHKKTIVLEGMDGVKQLIPGNFIFCPSICYRTEELGQERFRTDLKMVIDFEFILRFLFQGKMWVGYYEKPLFRYRRHSQNATTALTKNLNRFHEEITLYKNLSDRLLSAREPMLAVRARKMNVVRLNLLFQMAKSLLRFQFSAFIREAKLLMRITAQTV